MEDRFPCVKFDKIIRHTAGEKRPYEDDQHGVCDREGKVLSEGERVDCKGCPICQSAEFNQSLESIQRNTAVLEECCRKAKLARTQINFQRAGGQSLLAQLEGKRREESAVGISFAEVRSLRGKENLPTVANRCSS